MGIEYWQSLKQLAESPEMLERLSKEFPEYNPDEIVGLSRRRFMRLMGASMALAGLTLSGCRRWPQENIAPFSSNPRERIPGVPEQYATVYDIGGVGHGLLVTSYDGRPIKIEGNPSHPFAQTFDGKLGSADAFAQASVLELYDPDRSRGIVDRSDAQPRRATWEEFVKAIEPLRSGGGKGLAVLSEYSSSPSVATMRDNLLKKYPQTTWHEYEPFSDQNESIGLGSPVRTRLDLEKADVIVSLDADLLGSHPAHIRYANDWSKRRRSADEHGGMNRMYIAESRLSITGAVADERIGVRPSRIPLLAIALAAKLGVAGQTEPQDLAPEEKSFIDSAAADLKRGAGVVAAGADLAPEVHQLVHAINTTLGAYGKTVTLLRLPASPWQPIEKLKGDGITTLLIIGGNPVYDAPADLGFAELLASIPQSIHLSLYENETSLKCKWHVNRAHYLESWGDARAWDGTVSIQQPLILPLYGGKSAIEVLAMLCGEAASDGQTIVRHTRANLSDSDYRRALHDGVLALSGFQTATVQPAPGKIEPTSGQGLELRFTPDQKLFDGRFANSGWLQELPDSLSKLTWDNAALLSKKDADALGVDNGDMIRITAGERSLEIAAFILPGQPVGVIGLPLGYGRTAAGNVGNGVGFNTYSLRTTTRMSSIAGAKVVKTGATYALAATVEHHIIDPVGFHGRQERIGEKGHSGKIIREATFEEYQKDPHAPHHGQHEAEPLQLFNPPSEFNTPHAWGMAIDMSACIGCNACVVACQAENNVPVVGKDQVINNREMHWLRIDRYFKGEIDDPNPEIVFQPMMCVHCENAPCEQVCPVAATVHDSQGLNVMVYNRCIGTRYCSNNCPYKVRRFNYFDWHSKDPRGTARPWLGMPDSQQRESIDKIKQMIFNPEVTVRMRGVMEKCSYCVQRIHNTQSAKRTAGEELKDGDIVSACQQACPTEAIVFGDLNDENSKVKGLHKNSRAYSVLDNLHTRPRTRHLAKLRNPVEHG
ncbi:MAG TPA: TAT-variant-translocated molybdopterin oxidoreductase [Tepidisphaeraceae bacterium]|jgi:molybdopterin-containing oxidoreductase family iron-sulfur binding subunit